MDREPISVPIDEALIDLIPRYIQNRWADVEALEQALENEDFPTLQTLGHTMKGSGGGYGLHQVTVIGSGIEEAAKVFDSKAIRTWTEELKDYLQRVEVYPA
jgi:HPt (histidine-containing phosphotransfer) domain-containing protein